MLIKWIETLHSLTNVDISRCLPLFLQWFLDIISRDQKHEASEASFHQLWTFLWDYSSSPSRSVDLDKAIIKCVLNFLIENQRNKIDKGLNEAIRWLDTFLQFFIEDLHQERQDMEQLKKKKAWMAELRWRAEERTEESKDSFSWHDEESKGGEEDSIKKHIKELSTEVYPWVLQVVIYYINSKMDT